MAQSARARSQAEAQPRAQGCPPGRGGECSPLACRKAGLCHGLRSGARPAPLSPPPPVTSQVLLGCCVLIVISLLGLLVSCCPASHSRGLLATGYLCLGLPAWVLLVFVSVVALALRDEADGLVRSRALQPTWTGGWS